MRPKCKGTKCWTCSEHDGGIDWFIFAADVDIDTIYRNFKQAYYGPGQYYQDSPYVRRVRSRVLVKQSWGYDI
jgi:hypothetical protein